MQVYEPESVGMDSGRLECISTTLNEFVKDNQLPGMLALVQRRGKVVYFGKFGLMDIATAKPMREDALFRIYSMTKPIVSVALMMLYEEGRFSLKDPVYKFIPAFKKTKVYAGAGPLGLKLVEQDPEMTLHHLLTHTSGLSYGWFFDTPAEEPYRQTLPLLARRTTVLADYAEHVAELPLLFQPGTEWRYSIATDVVGRVIEVVSGMPLTDFLEQRIFKPLGMTDTAFYVPPEKLDRLAQIYASKLLYDPTVVKPDEVPGIGDVTTPTTCPIGGGGLISTLADYLAFGNFLINKGKYDGGRLLSRKTLDWMTSNHIPQSMRPLHMGPDVMDYGFGLGFRVTTSLGEARTLSSVGEFGWSGLAKTYFWVDPAEDFIGLFMSQHLPILPYPVTERFRNLSYQAIAD